MFTQNLESGKVEPGVRSLQPQSNLLLSGGGAKQAEADPYDNAQAPLLVEDDID